MNNLNKTIFGAFLEGLIEAFNDIDATEEVKQFNEFSKEDKEEAVECVNNVITNLMTTLGVKEYEKYLVTEDDLNNGVLVKTIELEEDPEEFFGDEQLDGDDEDCGSEGEDDCCGPDEDCGPEGEDDCCGPDEDCRLDDDCETCECKCKTETVPTKKTTLFDKILESMKEETDVCDCSMKVNTGIADLDDPTIELKPVISKTSGEIVTPANPYVFNNDNTTTKTSKETDPSEFAPEIKDPKSLRRFATSEDGSVFEVANPYVKEDENSPTLVKEWNETENAKKVGIDVNGNVYGIPSPYSKETLCSPTTLFPVNMKKLGIGTRNAVDKALNTNDNIYTPLNKETAVEEIDVKSKLINEFKTNCAENNINVEATINEIISCVIRQLSDDKTHDYRILPGDADVPPTVHTIVTEVNKVIKKRADILSEIQNRLKEKYGFNNVYTTIDHCSKDLVNLNYFLTLD